MKISRVAEMLSRFETICSSRAGRSSVMAMVPVPGQPDDRPPLEQRHAQLTLEVADLAAQRRLRHHEPLGRSLEPAFFCHGYHVAHEPKIDRHTRRVSGDNITDLGHPAPSEVTLFAVIITGTRPCRSPRRH
jgi:hypothetical protein